MTEIVACPQCGSRNRLPRPAVGSSRSCRGCKGVFRFNDAWDDGQSGWRLFGREDGAFLAKADARREVVARSAVVFALVAALLVGGGAILALTSGSLFEQGGKPARSGKWRRSEFGLRSFRTVKGDLSGPREVTRGPETYREVRERYSEHQEREQRYGGTYLQSFGMRARLDRLEAVATAGGLATVALGLTLLLALAAVFGAAVRRTSAGVRQSAVVVIVAALLTLAATVHFGAKLSAAAEPGELINRIESPLTGSGTLWMCRVAAVGALVLAVLVLTRCRAARVRIEPAT